MAGAALPGGATSAQTFTTGSKLFFGPGGRQNGADLLLAHELAHVVQQRGPGGQKAAQRPHSRRGAPGAVAFPGWFDAWYSQAWSSRAW